MTYDELMSEQKRKFFRLAKRLDDFVHGFSGMDHPDSTEEFMAWLDGKVPCDRHGGDHP